MKYKMKYEGKDRLKSRRKSRLKSMMWMILLLICLVPVGSAYGAQASNDIKLQLDGQAVATDVAPAIIQERTLIPVRALFEKMGGQVEWNEKEDKVEIDLNGTNVELYLNSKTALVNGVKTQMDVPATIVRGRTMIPVRFVAEATGCNVDWNQQKQMVIVESPEYFKKHVIQITNIGLSDQGNTYRVAISADKPMDKYNSFVLANPKRVVLDVQSAILPSGLQENNTGNELIKSVRFSQFEKSTIRVVLDLKGNFKETVTKSPDGKALYIDFQKPKNTNTNGKVSADGLPMIDWRIAESLIVIDPGHGGKDSGSLGKENGQIVLKEKDINIDVATKLNALLKNAGANTYMTRHDDTFVELKDRPGKANALGADLLIGIHNNSATATAARGTETLYFSKPSEGNYDISSKYLAQVIQKELIKELGTVNRKTVERPGLAVLRLSDMPAIIVEGAFISNQEDLNYMKTAEFRERYARAVARATIQVLNETAAKF